MFLISTLPNYVYHHWKKWYTLLYILNSLSLIPWSILPFAPWKRFLMIFAGTIGEVELGAQAIVFQTEALCFMVSSYFKKRLKRLEVRKWCFHFKSSCDECDLVSNYPCVLRTMPSVWIYKVCSIWNLCFYICFKVLGANISLGNRHQFLIQAILV